MLFSRFLSVLVCMLFLITGCSSGFPGSKSTPVLTADETKEYRKLAADFLDKKFWNTGDSISVNYSELPKDLNQGMEALALKKSAESGLDYSSYAGQQVIQVNGTLQHDNGDEAGKYYIYIVNRKVVGAYYTARIKGEPETVFSLEERNLFLKKAAWNKFEEPSSMRREYSEIRIPFSTSAISIGKWVDGLPVILSIRPSDIEILRAGTGGLQKIAGFEERDAKYVDAFSADVDQDRNVEMVVLSSDSDRWWTEDAKGLLRIYEVEGMNFHPEYSFELRGPIMKLEYDGKHIIICHDSGIHFYELRAGNLDKAASIEKKGYVISGDMDGNGDMEYVVRDLDNRNLSMYRLSGQAPAELWKTHGINEVVFGYFSMGDLNGDGVKEVYTGGTATGKNMRRYILTETGLKVYNEQLPYGYQYIAGELNGDGKDDYLVIPLRDGNEGKIMLAR